jgi:hemolysin D
MQLRVRNLRTGSTTRRLVLKSSTSEPKGQELVYAARISLDRTQMQVEENLAC